MKKAGIISIGNEIVSGEIADTNSRYLIERLLEAGIPVVGTFAVGDNVDSIVDILRYAVGRAEIILVTGGLGPTDDDVTRQAFAKFLGSELVFRPEFFNQIERFFKRRNIEMPARNKIQAYIPAGAEGIVNNNGTAPGIKAEYDGRGFFAFPGVPVEMKKMFEESVLPLLEGLAGEQAVVIRKLKCFGAGESRIAETLGDLMRRDRNPLINCTVGYGVITLYVVAEAESKVAAEKMAEKDFLMLKNLLGEIVYGTDEQTLAEVVGQKLAAGGKTVAVAESCTGGLVAKLLTDVPGSSGYFRCGWVTYSNESKVKQLGVGSDIIEKYGAVSAEVASEMAKWARRTAGVDFGVGITGIAGPGGGSEEKPVGLVYICVDSSGGGRTNRYVFSQGRETIRFLAANNALNMLRLQIPS